jgi:mannose-6-phosphate isomerase-like protein (cupin superfamily)
MLVSTDLLAAFDSVADHWSPRVIGRVNDQYLKVAKLKGEFVWHDHAEEDELFFIVRGALRMELEDGAVELSEGQFLTVPRGVRHRPVAEQECWVLLIETVTTRHTGDVVDPRTRTLQEQLA